MIDLRKAKEFAEKLALEVGRFLLKNQNKVKVLEFKDRQDVLTNIDLQAEKLILEAIKKEYPKHGILSEEKGLIEKKSSYKWVIDPLDGTKEYIRGIPLYNTSLALEKNEEIILAVVYRPCGNDLYSAAAGLGAYHNQKVISPSEQKDLSKSFVYTYLPSYKAGRGLLKIWRRLDKIVQKCYRLRGTADENSALCWVANGACEAYVNISNVPGWWDIAPGLLIAQEAGAKTTDVSGQSIKNKYLSKGLVVSNDKIHKELIQILS